MNSFRKIILINGNTRSLGNVASDLVDRLAFIIDDGDVADSMLRASIVGAAGGFEYFRVDQLPGPDQAGVTVEWPLGYLASGYQRDAMYSFANKYPAVPFVIHYRVFERGNEAANHADEVLYIS